MNTKWDATTDGDIGLTEVKVDARLGTVSGPVTAVQIGIAARQDGKYFYFPLGMVPQSWQRFQEEWIELSQFVEINTSGIGVGVNTLDGTSADVIDFGIVVLDEDTSGDAFAHSATVHIDNLQICYWHGDFAENTQTATGGATLPAITASGSGDAFTIHSVTGGATLPAMTASGSGSQLKLVNGEDIPTRLTATITAAGSNADGATVPLTYKPATDKWEGSADLGTCNDGAQVTIEIDVYYDGTDSRWELDYTITGNTGTQSQTGVAVTATSFSPVDLDFDTLDDIGAALCP